MDMCRRRQFGIFAGSHRSDKPMRPFEPHLGGEAGTPHIGVDHQSAFSRLAERDGQVGQDGVLPSPGSGLE